MGEMSSTDSEAETIFPKNYTIKQIFMLIIEILSQFIFTVNLKIQRYLTSNLKGKRKYYEDKVI